MLKSKTARLIWGILFFTWSITIIVLILIPDEELVKLGVDNSEFRWDYVHHFSAFLLFALLFLLWRGNDPEKRRLIMLLLAGVFFASFTELSQLFIPSRNFNYIDLLCNLAGLPAGIILVRFFTGLRASST